MPGQTRFCHLSTADWIVMIVVDIWIFSEDDFYICFFLPSQVIMFLLLIKKGSLQLVVTKYMIFLHVGLERKSASFLISNPLPSKWKSEHSPNLRVAVCQIS